MAVSVVAKKLLVKPGMRMRVVNAPDGYRDLLEPLPDGAIIVDGGSDLDFVQLFVRQAADLDRVVPNTDGLRPGGLLWVCYRKGGAKPGTDLNRDTLHANMEQRGWIGVSLVSIDDRWSAMRFRRPEDVGRG